MNFNVCKEVLLSNNLVVNQPLNVLSEMANTLKLRRLSMQGASHDKDQVTTLVTPTNL